VYQGLHAVVIGVGRHADPQHDLGYARSDAEFVTQVLHDEFGFSILRTLYDEHATRAAIQACFENDLQTVGEDDGVVIFYAGHGITARDPLGNDRGFLLPHDGNPERPLSNLSMQVLRDEWLPMIPAKHVFLIVDACYGGLALREVRAAPRSVAPDAALLAELTRKDRKIRQVLSAGGRDQRVLDGGLFGRSVFTGHLVQALREADPYALADHVGALVKQRVARDSADRGHPQTPSFGYAAGGDGTFVFERRPRGVAGAVPSRVEATGSLPPLPEPDRQKTGRSEIVRARSFLERGDLGQARVALETALRLDANASGVGDLERAISQRQVEVAAIEREARTRLARADFGAAHGHLDAVERLWPTKVGLADLRRQVTEAAERYADLVREAHSHVDARRWSDATSAAQRAAVLCPDAAEPATLLARAAAGRKRDEQAETRDRSRRDAEWRRVEARERRGRRWRLFWASVGAPALMLMIGAIYGGVVYAVFPASLALSGLLWQSLIGQLFIAFCFLILGALALAFLMYFPLYYLHLRHVEDPPNEPEYELYALGVVWLLVVLVTFFTPTPLNVGLGGGVFAISFLYAVYSALSRKGGR